MIGSACFCWVSPFAFPPLWFFDDEDTTSPGLALGKTNLLGCFGCTLAKEYEYQYEYEYDTPPPTYRISHIF